MAKKAAKHGIKPTRGRPSKPKEDDFDFGLDGDRNAVKQPEAPTAPTVEKKKLSPGFIGECPIKPGPKGDKDPAVVEWFRDNDPEEFERRYNGRTTHLSNQEG